MKIDDIMNIKKLSIRIRCNKPYNCWIRTSHKQIKNGDIIQYENYQFLTNIGIYNDGEVITITYGQLIYHIESEYKIKKRNQKINEIIKKDKYNEVGCPSIIIRLKNKNR